MDARYNRFTVMNKKLELTYPIPSCSWGLAQGTYRSGGGILRDRCPLPWCIGEMGWLGSSRWTLAGVEGPLPPAVLVRPPTPLWCKLVGTTEGRKHTQPYRNSNYWENFFYCDWAEMDYIQYTAKLNFFAYQTNTRFSKHYKLSQWIYMSWADKDLLFVL